MGALKNAIQKAAQAFAPKPQRIADRKRELEARLRAGGLSRAEAKKAVAAHFRGQGE